MKLVVEVEVIGTDWRMRSATISGKDAEEMFDIINNRLEKVSMLTLPDLNGYMVFLNRSILDRSIVSVKKIEN